jgi:hypothetical protein
MSFSLQLSFTGIVAFIQLIEYGPVYLVMPGLEGAKDALDDEPLCPHNSYIELDKRYAEVPLTPGKNFDRTSLKGQVVTFQLAYEAGTPNAATDLPDELIDMQVLLGELCILNQDVLARTSPPRPAFVMTQVELPPGEYTGHSDAAEEWSIDQVDPRYGEAIDDVLAHEVWLTITNLTAASAILTPMDGATPPVALALTPKDGNANVYAQLVNTCKEVPDSEPRTYRDRDFKWYFELLDHDIKKTIADLIGYDDLPIPRYVATYESREKESKHVTSANGGHDCFPAQMAGYGSSSQAQLRGRHRRRHARRPRSPKPPVQTPPSQG